MVDGVNQQPGLFQRIGNFFGAGNANAGQRTGTPFFPEDPNAGQPTDPFAGLSRAQRTMLGFAALRDAASALEGRDSNFFAQSLGGFEQARERERLRTQGMLQNLANIEQQIAIAQFTGIPVSPAMLQMRDMLTQQLAPTAPTLTAGAAPVTGATPTSGAMPSMPGAVAPAQGDNRLPRGTVFDPVTGTTVPYTNEPEGPATETSTTSAPTPAPASDIDAQIAAQQQRQLELLEAIDVQGRGAQGLGLPANTAALEAELRIVNDEINRLRDQKTAEAAAAIETQEKMLISEDAAREAGFYVNLIESVIQDPKLEGIVGRIEGRVDPRGAGGAILFDEGEMNIISKLEQLGGAAFLQAFESLKGGGQITQIEGEKATQAITRLGQRAVSPENYRAALNELRQVYANAQARARGQELPFPEINVEGAAPSAGASQTPQISSDEEYNALPSGAQFIDPEGVLRRKP